MRKRNITKYGSAIVIRLTRNDLLDMDLKVGDIVDISDITKVKKRKEDKQNE